MFQKDFADPEVHKILWKRKCIKSRESKMHTFLLKKYTHTFKTREIACDLMQIAPSENISTHCELV